MNHQSSRVNLNESREFFEKLSERELRNAWYEMIQKGFPLPDEDEHPVAYNRQLLAEHIAENHDGRNWLIFLKNQNKNYLLPDNEIKWFEKQERRANIWLYNELKGKKPLTRIVFLPLKEIPLDNICKQIVISLDRSRVNVQQKQNLINQLKLDWGQARTPDSQMNWLSPKDEKQINWAWSYLYKQEKAINTFQPTNRQEIYDLVIASIDGQPYPHPDSKKLFLDKMKKTWSQKKYRDSDKAKKQCSLPMTPATKARLTQIAQNNNETIGKTLERLINKEFTLINEDVIY